MNPRQHKAMSKLGEYLLNNCKESCEEERKALLTMKKVADLIPTKEKK